MPLIFGILYLKTSQSAHELVSFTLLKFHQFYCEGDFAPPIRMGLGFPLKKKAFEQP
jgi:hypothetical protein